MSSPNPLECEIHTWVLWTFRELNICEECGMSEPADPYDIAEQHRLLADIDRLSASMSAAGL